MQKMQKNNKKRICELFEEKTGVKLDRTTAHTEHARTRSNTVRKLLPAFLFVLLLSLTAIATIATTRTKKEVDYRWEITGWHPYATGDDKEVELDAREYVLSLTFKIESTAPGEIEDFFLPRSLPDESIRFCDLRYHGSNKNCRMKVRWAALSPEQSGITFCQYSAGYSPYDLATNPFPSEIEIRPQIITDQEPEVIEATFGGVSGYYIPTYDMRTERKLFCWCDGNYVYQLEIPRSFTDDEIHDIVASVGRVSDIEPYLAMSQGNDWVDNYPESPIEEEKPVETEEESPFPYQLFYKTIQFDMEPSAPENVETYYLPQCLGTEKITDCFVYISGKERFPLFLAIWSDSLYTVARGGIKFFQYSLSMTDRDPFTHDIRVRVGIHDTTEPEVIEVTFGGTNGYYIPSHDKATERKLFFWSDGNYVYRLEVPYDFTVEQIDAIVSSVERVEDIRPYLQITMSDEDITRVLGDKNSSG